jgi:hypothetical protein
MATVVVGQRVKTDLDERRSKHEERRSKCGEQISAHGLLPLTAHFLSKLARGFTASTRIRRLLGLVA